MDDAVPRPGGFWIRLVAFGVDVVVIMLAQFLLGLLAARRWGVDVERSSTLQGAIVFFTLLFAILYPTVLHALTGQTIGKLLVGVRVLATDGELLPPGAAFLRAVVHWLSLAFILGLGHVLAALRKDKRALHDLLAGSRVERTLYAPRRSAAVPPPPAAVLPPAGSQPL